MGCSSLLPAVLTASFTRLRSFIAGLKGSGSLHSWLEPWWCCLWLLSPPARPAWLSSQHGGLVVRQLAFVMECSKQESRRS